MEKIRRTIRISKALSNDIKRLGINEGKSFNDLNITALTDLLAKHKTETPHPAKRGKNYRKGERI